MKGARQAKAAWRNQSKWLLPYLLLAVFVACTLATVGLLNHRLIVIHWWECLTVGLALMTLVGFVLYGVRFSRQILATEALMRASETKYRTLFESSADAIMTLKPPMWKFVTVNPAALAMFGARDAEHFGTFGPWDLSPAQQPDGRTSDEKAGEMIETALREGTHIFEWTHRRITGESFPSTVLLSRVKTGGKVFLQATVRDITEQKRAEEALQKIEHQIDHARSLAKLVAWDYDVADGLFTFSDQYYVLHGTTAELEGGHRMSAEAFARKYVHPDDAYLVAGEIGKAVATTDPDYQAELECRIVRRDGALRHVHVYITIAKDAAGKTIQLHGANQDITERKRAEAYRDAAREVLQILSEPGDMPDSIQRVLAVLKTRIGFDAVGIRLQAGDDFPYFAHAGFSKDFLRTENTLVARAVDGELCRDKDGNICLECTCGLVIAGKIPTGHPLFTPGGSFWTNDSFPLLDLPVDQDPRLHPRNRCVHLGYASVALTPIRNKGRIMGLLQFNSRQKNCFTRETVELLEGIAAHIGDALIRNQMEAALRASEVRFRYLFESLPQLVWTCQPDGRCDFLSPQWVEFTGIPEAPQLGYGWLEQIHPDDRESTKAAWESALNAGSDFHVEFRIRRHDGVYRWFYAYAVLLKDSDGHLTKWYGSNTDITKRKQAEEMARAKNMEVEQFTYAVSHDLRSPVVTIQTFLGHLEGDISARNAARVETDLNFIRTAVNKMAQMLDELLNLSRFGHQINPPADVLLQDVVKDALDLVAGRITQRGAQVTVVGEPVTLHGDRAGLVALFQNLADNACKFMGDQKEPRIEIGVEGCDGETVFFVRDNGGGIDPRHQSKVFGLFEKLDPKAEGTGIGLALVKRIVESYAGRIRVESAGPGQGACFYFTLPGAIQKAKEGEKS